MKNRLPARAKIVAKDYPEVWARYQRLGVACAEAGPIAPATRRLVKLALAVGRGSEGAVHSHVRQALAEGATPAQLRQVAVLAMPTLGFPAGVAALTWIDDILAPRKSRRAKA